MRKERTSKITENMLQQAILMYRQGQTLAVIARSLGVCRATIVLHLRKHLGLQYGERLKSGGMFDIKGQRVAQDCNDGLKSAELLSKKYGITTNTVRFYLSKYNARLTDDKDRILYQIKCDYNKIEKIHGWQSELARKYGVTRQRISAIIKKIESEQISPTTQIQ